MNFNFHYLTIAAATATAALTLQGCSCSRQGDATDSVAELTEAQKDSLVVNREVDVFSAQSPLTLEIKRERSFYQADRVAKRLLRMGVDAYVVQSGGKNAADNWYIVVSGAFASKDSLEAYRTRLDTTYNLPIAKAKALDYATLDSIASKPVKSVAKASEVKRIEANQPDVPQPVRDVILHMPKDDNFYLQNVAVLMLNSKGIDCAKGRVIDLPRGVTLSKLKSKGCTAMASALLRNNLFGDVLTVQAIRCPDQPKTAPAAIMPLPPASTACQSMRDVCSALADDILKSGKYANTAKETCVIKSFYSDLTGYHVSFEDKGKPRSYFILTDQAGEYIYIGQSSRTDDTDMEQILASIRTDDGGLEAYDEFHNTFDTISDEQQEGDTFLGYYTDKLDWSYARSKGNAEWARKMVGHWQASSFFHNKSKGTWCFALFDLTSKTKGDYIYANLYRNGFDSDYLRTIYGTKGVAVWQQPWYGARYLTEVNFGIARYVVAIGPTNLDADYTERDLVVRAEDLQFNRGGYDSETASTTSSSSPDGDYTPEI